MTWQLRHEHKLSLNRCTVQELVCEDLFPTVLNINHRVSQYFLPLTHIHFCACLFFFLFALLTS